MGLNLSFWIGNGNVGAGLLTSWREIRIAGEHLIEGGFASINGYGSGRWETCHLDQSGDLILHDVFVTV